MDWRVRLRARPKANSYTGFEPNREHEPTTREIQMRLYQMADAVRYEMMNTEELRETFLLEGMFQPGEIEFAYVDFDRTVTGWVGPESEALTLETETVLRAEDFL